MVNLFGNALKQLWLRGSYEQKGAIRYFLNNAYELPPTPPGVRPFVVKNPDDTYRIEYQIYCAVCGRAFEVDGLSSWWVDIDSASTALDECDVTSGVWWLGDGRPVCAEWARCRRLCSCVKCQRGIRKIIGTDQEDCTSEPKREESSDE
jgi:hypothetical protein